MQFRERCRWQISTALVTGNKQASIIFRAQLVVSYSRVPTQQDVLNMDPPLRRESAVVVREPKLKVDLTKYVEDWAGSFDPVEC